MSGISYLAITDTTSQHNIIGFAIDHTWVETTFSNSSTKLELDPSWKNNTYSTTDQAFLNQYNGTSTSYSSVGQLVADNYSYDFLDATDNPYYQSSSNTQLASEYFADRVSEFLSQQSAGLTLADLGYQGLIEPVLTTRNNLPVAPATDQIWNGTATTGQPVAFSNLTGNPTLRTLDPNLDAQTWKLTISLDYSTDSGGSYNTLSSMTFNGASALSIPAYSQTPIELTWNGTTPQLNALNLDGTTSVVGNSSSAVAAGTTNFRLNLGLINPGFPTGDNNPVDAVTSYSSAHLERMS